MLQMCVQFIHAAPPLLYRKNTQNTQPHPSITTTSNVDTIFFPQSDLLLYKRHDYAFVT